MVGANEKEHDANLERVMTKLQDNRITLNYDKCEIGVSSMTYMGDVLSGEGLKVSDEQVKAIVEAPAPQNQSEVRFPWFCSVLCKVHHKLRNNIKSTVGPDLQSGRMALGSKRG